MRYNKFSLAALALLLSGCGSVEGIVRDGTTGEPISGASVTLTYSNDPSGFFRKPQLEQVSTDSDGRFTIDQDGGIELSVSTSDGRNTRTGPCARSPFDVYVGGPFAGKRIQSTLVLSSSGEPREGDLPELNRKKASELGLTFSQIANEEDLGYEIEASGGIAFVPGTGEIPAPPPLPYAKTLSLDFGKDCGWVFVERNDRVVAAIEARPPGRLATPGGYREITLMFADLP